MRYPVTWKPKKALHHCCNFIITYFYKFQPGIEILAKFIVRLILMGFFPNKVESLALFDLADQLIEKLFERLSKKKRE
ncbi:MAG: hypothetical protein DYG98_13530 [Haliscomenobacteraceae bacterium CHB4]|nr:hypothetical protein [Saprospiraceae bacterium]MCE7924070.1 hypothetical protein [Haliscomenobacteraceae bacterium CHB4]